MDYLRSQLQIAMETISPEHGPCPKKMACTELRGRFLLFLFFCGFLAACVAKPATGQFNNTAFHNMTFLSNWTSSDQAKLTNGEYCEAPAPGSASHIVVKLTNTVAFGNMHGNDVAAVILVTDSGGSGTFYDVAFLIKEPQGWRNVDVAFLGDRVKVHSVGLEEDKIVIDMTTHGPKDPLCCPTHRTIRAFAVQDIYLTEVVYENREDTSEVVVNTVWKWQQTLENNDTKAVPPDPNQYTLKLLPEGRVSIRADCNQGGGVYTLNGSHHH